MNTLSPLQQLRTAYRPPLPPVLKNLKALASSPVEGAAPTVSPEIAALFPETHAQAPVTFAAQGERSHAPLRVGVVLSGGQAAGGHNVITGLHDALIALHPESLLLGFLNGPSGLIENTSIVLDAATIAPYRNQGGFDMIGSGRTKIETDAQFAAVQATAESNQLDGIVIIGGDDSNTNAALLAAYFLKNGLKTRVVGVPKTIDGDLKNAAIEVSFGFDTACKTYAETVGSLLRDALSAKKYTFFVRLMGRSASHIALECALQTHPNYTLIGEEIAAENKSVREITGEICDVICARAALGKNYGVVLIPEGIVEFIPEFRALIDELNRGGVDTLSPACRACFDALPEAFQQQLTLDRDPHGNVQVAKIETERFFIALVEKELAARKMKGTFEGKMSAQPLYLGYEGRSCLPSNFDAAYCTTLGHVAALLIADGRTGYMACVQNLAKPVSEWTVGGTPIVPMMNLEERHGEKKPVIEKALVDLEGAPFVHFSEHRVKWAIEDDYRNPGPIQFEGDSSVCNGVTMTLALESAKK